MISSSAYVVLYISDSVVCVCAIGMFVGICIRVRLRLRVRAAPPCATLSICIPPLDILLRWLAFILVDRPREWQEKESSCCYMLCAYNTESTAHRSLAARRRA